MAAQPSKQDQSIPLIAHVGHRLREGLLLLMVFGAGYFLLALLTYSPQDPGWSYSGPTEEVQNAAGPAGAWFADVLFYLFGLLAYLFPAMLCWSGWLVLRQRNPDDSANLHLVVLRWSGFLLTLSAGSALAALYARDAGHALPMGAGGVLGELLRAHLVALFSSAGSTLLLVAVLLSGLTLFTGLSWLAVMDAVGGLTLDIADRLTALPRRFSDFWAARRARQQRSEVVRVEKKKAAKRTPPKIEPLITAVKPSPRVERERQVPLFEPAAGEGGLPALSLLTEPGPRDAGYSPEALQALSRQVEMKLKDFGIEAEVVEVHPGPVITLFELHLAPGTKASRVTNLAKDLARALSTISVRVVEVIPGKSTIGLEIPNEKREIVYLSEVLRSEVYDKARSPLTLALGKDISGSPVVADLGRMPHGLIAGTTGSGKSVAINAMVLSLLYKARPDEVRLIMIDPKMLELSVYEGIPHLLTPVVTDMKEAANALRWCVAEMERRYRLMAALGVRNIAGFNRKVIDAEKAGAPIIDPLYEPSPLAEAPVAAPPLVPLPYVVVIVDELADMMMVVGKKVEELIARLAQKARASGVHLLLATQRPSVDVITGLIKANIPTRIAFQVSARVDSRTILDQMGAEHLLGHGDMLYLAPGGSIPQRIHGAFVDDNEVHRVVEYLKTTGEPEYIDEVLQEPTEATGGLNGGQGEDIEDDDPLYDEAVRIVTETRRASISGVQRRLKIGYNRAARLIEEMERTGIVTPPEHNGNREVLAPAPPDD